MELVDVVDSKSTAGDSVPVRVRSPAPRRSKLCIACSDLFHKSERAHAAAPPLQTATASLGCGLGPPLRGGFVCRGKNIDFNRPFHVGAKSALLRRLFMPMAKKTSSARSLAPPFQLRPTPLGSQLVCRPAGGVF